MGASSAPMASPPCALLRRLGPTSDGCCSFSVRNGGRPCNVCGKAIASITQEHEVEGAEDTYALAHPDCYRIWREESRRLKGPSD
jgi:hypothetical protein